jgi:hypothetical protein
VSARLFGRLQDVCCCRQCNSTSCHHGLIDGIVLLHVVQVNAAAAAAAPSASKKQRSAAATAGGFVKVQGGSSKAGQTGIAAFLCKR